MAENGGRLAEEIGVLLVPGRDGGRRTVGGREVEWECGRETREKSENKI